MAKTDKSPKQARQRRVFTPEFKVEAVRLCQVGDRTIAQVAVDLELTESALREWIHRVEQEAQPPATGALTSDEREELMRLRRDNKRLQMEREILKKLSRASPHLRARSSGATTSPASGRSGR